MPHLLYPCTECLGCIRAHLSGSVAIRILDAWCYDDGIAVPSLLFMHVLLGSSAGCMVACMPARMRACTMGRVSCDTGRQHAHTLYDTATNEFHAMVAVRVKHWLQTTTLHPGKAAEVCMLDGYRQGPSCVPAPNL